MEDVLELLKSNFIEVINQVEKKVKLHNCEDALGYYILLGGTAKNFRDRIESTALPAFRINDTENLKICLLNGFIAETWKSSQVKSYYITIKGLGHLLLLENDQNKILNVLSCIDEFKLPKPDLKFKKEEVLLVLFLLVCNATSPNSKLNVPETAFSLKITHEKLKELALDIQKNFPKIIRNEIDFSRGKKVSWTRFITELNNLPKSGLYNKKRNDTFYYLDLQTNKSIQLLKELCFNDLDTFEKLALKRFIVEKNIMLRVTLTDQLPSTSIDTELLNKLLS